MTNNEIRNAIAELIGTFMLVFVGAGAVALTANPLNGLNVMVPALAHGFILVAIVATFGSISGAHVNPAVTLGLLVGGKINLRNAAFYWVAQLVGAFLAAGVLRVVLPGGDFLNANGQTTNYLATLGQTLPADGVTDGMILVLEGILTFFLVGSVYQSAVYGKTPSLAPLMIGLTLAAAILMGGSLTGASLNPARTIGPAFLAKESQNVQEVMFYVIGTMLGGLLAGFVHSDLFAPAGGDSDKKKR